jgi:hypothetical protein
LDFPVEPEYGFSWWIPSTNLVYDWGPNWADSGCVFSAGGLGYPSGDKGKYCMISKSEVDYDQFFAALDYSDVGWLPPSAAPGYAMNLADGYDTRFTISFGAVDLPPDSSFVFAYVVAIGDGFHVNPDDFASYFSHSHPDTIYDYLDFSDLENNVITARQLYTELSWYICGNANGDEAVNVSDVVYILNYVFISGSPPPHPLESAEVNCDGMVNVSDAVWLLNYIFISGPAPCECK